MAKAKGRYKKLGKSGTRYRHGGYAYLTTGEIPEHRQYIQKYLTAIREGLIKDIGPTEKDLTIAQLILIDRLVSLLGVIRLIEEKAKEDGIFKGQELTPSLKQSYIAYNNTVRLTLEKLGINTKRGDEALDVQGYIKAFDEKKKKGKGKE